MDHLIEHLVNVNAQYKQCLTKIDTLDANEQVKVSTEIIRIENALQNILESYEDTIHRLDGTFEEPTTYTQHNSWNKVLYEFMPYMILYNNSLLNADS